MSNKNTRREQILKLVEFDEEYIFQHHIRSHEYADGGYTENHRLMPLITAMASRIDELEGALEFYASCRVDGLMEPINVNEWQPLGTRARQALSNTSALDEILKGDSDGI